MSDRRTIGNQRRRTLTPEGEIVVEVPFTEAQARGLLAVLEAFGYTEDLHGAHSLLHACLDFATARALSGLTSGQRQGWIDTGLIEPPLETWADGKGKHWEETGWAGPKLNLTPSSDEALDRLYEHALDEAAAIDANCVGEFGGGNDYN